MSDTCRYDIAQNGRYRTISLTLRVISYIPVAVQTICVGQQPGPIIIALTNAPPKPGTRRVLPPKVPQNIFLYVAAPPHPPTRMAESEKYLTMTTSNYFSVKYMYIFFIYKKKLYLFP